MVGLTHIKATLENQLTDRILKSEALSCNVGTLKQKVQTWKNEGYTIVFTAGVFDIFTVNHLLGLYHYRLLGGNKVKLIISIDTDERVRSSKSFIKEKGNTIKPILSWQSRAMMIGFQSFRNEQPLVDLIVQHGKDTCNATTCPHDDNVTIAEIIQPEIVVVTSTSTQTIDALHGSTIIRDETIKIIYEDQLTYDDELLQDKISTSAIIKRVVNGC